MSLLPENNTETLDEYLLRQGDAVDEPTFTYRLDFDTGRISGMVDEQEAMKQFIRKAIITARARYPIYTDDYGCELPTLIGQDVTRDYIDAEIPRMVKEALIYDDRITSVTRLRAEQRGDAVFIVATVDTIFGEFTEEVVM